MIKIWLCDLTYTQQVISCDVMPAAVGKIAAYCEAQLSPAPAIRLFKYPEKLIAALRGEQPDIIGFSNYMWNTRLSYGLAQAIKARFPRTVVVMGGPDFPLSAAHQEAFLRSRPAVDFYVEKEGELPFANLVRRLGELDFDIERVKREQLASVRAVTADGAFHAGPLAARMDDLSGIPSPYSSGKLDEFFDGKLTPIVQTTRGCPFTCTYCVEGSKYYARTCRPPAPALAAEIDYIGRKMQAVRESGGRNDLHVADSNFGMYAEDLEAARYIAEAQDRYGWPDYIVCSTGKNQHERVMEVARLVRGKIRVSGSVQSTDSEVLANVRRKNVQLGQIYRLAEEANATGAESHSEVILGLPGDSAERHIRSIADLIEVGFSNIRMYQLILLMGTPLYAEAREGTTAFEFGTQFRVVPFDYGDYAFDADTRIVTAEIEEIVTSLKDLSRDDYFRCRRFDLVVDTFYNQSVFQALLKLLKNLGVSRFAWIRKVWAAVEDSGVAAVMDAFEAETRAELWDSREDLQRFASRPENIARFLSGELGGKLIFKYKAILSHNHLDELAAVARRTAREILAEHGQTDAHLTALVDDLLTYEVVRKTGLFRGDYMPKPLTMTYDIEAFLKARDWNGAAADLKFPEPRRCRFYLEPEQIQSIERALNTYGRDLSAMTKIVSYLRIEDYYRRFEYLT